MKPPVAIASSFAIAALVLAGTGPAPAQDAPAITFAKSAGALVATATGGPSSLLFDYGPSGCGDNKQAPCFVFHAGHALGPKVTASAPADCSVDAEDIATINCLASDYSGVVIVKSTDGGVTLGGGTGQAPNCAPVPVSVSAGGTQNVVSWDGCQRQSITCAPKSFVTVEANAFDGVTGPCKNVTRH
ncbi:MAG TPA: hypothetical protein VMF61_01930 [Candidatus Acidoferrales bacterium]|nr:hypothetical protein [Candidatus Acidoferrales bacterium]